MDFSIALLHVKNGDRVAREGWNGKGMWLGLSSWGMWEGPGIVEDTDEFLPFIYMKTADDMFVPWLASQTDILAVDWEVVRNVTDE